MTVNDPPGAEPEEAQTLPTRRAFMGGGAAIAGGVVLMGAAPALATATDAFAATTTAGALTSAEVDTLKSVLNVLFPEDDLGPGAVAANVHVYIDRSLSGAFKAMLPTYKGMLAMFEKSARAMGAKSFASLSGSQQNDLITQFEAGTPPGSTESKQAVAGNFQLLLEHMREGLFGDPMYGGNKDLAGWKLIGYPGIQLVWSPQSQAVGAPLHPTNKTAKSYGGKPYNGPPV